MSLILVWGQPHTYDNDPSQWSRAGGANSGGFGALRVTGAGVLPRVCKLDALQKGEAQKSPLFWQVFLGVFDFFRSACSLGISLKKPLFEI